ncbi:MAG: erythromycin esterase family protein [Kangiellaceae bacterium]|nr:erythromycin esterase family protein [Kangiellaceae bacterium]
MKRPFILILCLACLTACQNQSLKVENTDTVALSFERATPENRPLGWYIEEYTPLASVIVANSSSAYDGRSVLSIENKGDEPVVFYTTLPEIKKCITKLKISAQGRSTTGGKVASVVFVAGADSPMIAPTLDLGSNWTNIQHEIKASGKCLTLPSYFGFLSFGTLHLDNVVLTFNENSPIEYLHLSPLSENNLNAISRISATSDFDSGGPALKEIFERKVLGLGENSHGAAALFKLKLDLLKTLAARNLGVVALEMPAAAAEIVDDYVAGRANDRSRVISALIYPAWQTYEMLAVVDWLRERNATAKDPIKFVGFDVQHPHLTLQILKRNWPKESQQLDKLAEAMEKDIDTALKILASLNQKENLSDANKRYLRLISRGLLAGRLDLGGQSRDAYMAMEVIEIVSKTDRQIVLWAYNTHITKVAGAMGAFLSAKFGTTYASIGLTFGSGNYSALGPATPYLAEAQYNETHESILSKANIDGRFIALMDLPIKHPLLDLRGFRYIGSSPQELGQFLPHNLTSHFDVVGYVEKTTATTFLVEHNF